jgi:glycosyltransferase involved in cell wall biosynthesis
LRIAVWHNLPSGGAKRALYNQILALRQYGHYLEAWTTDLSSPDYLPLTELIQEHRKPVKADYEKVIRTRNSVLKEIRISRLLDSHMKECSREIESGNFDILFASSCAITYMPFIGEFLSLPKIVYLGEPYRILHEAMPENIWQAPYRNLRLRKIKRIYRDFLLNYSRRIRLRREIDAAKSFDRILVNSLFSRENVLRAYGIDATVCYLGIDTGTFGVDIREKEPYVVCLGTVSFIKGVHRVIQIVSRISDSIRPEIRWIGNGSDDYYKKEMIRLAE